MPITLKLTTVQARGLLAFAQEGAEGLLVDPAACRAYIGNGAQVVAAGKALSMLERAIPPKRRRLAAMPACRSTD